MLVFNIFCVFIKIDFYMNIHKVHAYLLYYINLQSIQILAYKLNPSCEYSKIFLVKFVNGFYVRTTDFWF